MCEAQGKVGKLVYVMEKTAYITGGGRVGVGGGGGLPPASRFPRDKQQLRPHNFRLKLPQTMLLPAHAIPASLELETDPHTSTDAADRCLGQQVRTNGFTTALHTEAEPGAKQGKFLSQLSFNIGGNGAGDCSALRGKRRDSEQCDQLDQPQGYGSPSAMDHSVSTLHVFVNKESDSFVVESKVVEPSLSVICAECNNNNKEECVECRLHSETVQENSSPPHQNQKDSIVLNNSPSQSPDKNPHLGSSTDESAQTSPLHCGTLTVESPWGPDDPEDEGDSSFRRVSTWPWGSSIPVIYVDEQSSNSDSSEEAEEREEAEGGTLPGLPGLSNFLSEFHARARSPHNMYDGNGDDLVKLKDMTKRLNLATRRESYTEWKERYLNKPLLWRRRSFRAFSQDLRDEKEAVREEAPLLDAEEEGWSEERRLRIDSALDWLRKELTEMREQDQALARSLITLREDLREFKLRKCCAENQELIEEALEQEDERDVLSDLSDLPPSPFSPTLKNYGVTRMNISTRRFSVF